MASLEGLVASLQGPLMMEQFKRAQAQQQAPAVEAGKPMSIQDLLGKIVPTPIPIGTPFAQGYAPGGPQLNFTGGSPFPVDDTPGAIHNGALVLKQLADVIGELRKKRAAAKAQSASKPAEGK